MSFNDSQIGFHGMEFLHKICAVSRKKKCANFCASFAHEAEQLLRNIPHCTASHINKICAYLHKIICAKIKITQNYLRK